jgi:hypothetical protein
MTRGQLKTVIRLNLADVGIVRCTDEDLNTSLQDAYDDIVILTQCIVKRTTINWVADLSYYDFLALGIADYLTTTAIFNNVTNYYLRDDLSIRDFDGIRRDWELWNGTPQFWAPCSPSKIAIAAKYTGGTVTGAFNPLAFSNAFFIGSAPIGTFDLIYAATAPTFTVDTDSPLIASDMQVMFEDYCTADFLEQDEEFTKASIYWQSYYSNIDKYVERVKKINKSDLLLRV